MSVHINNTTAQTVIGFEHQLFAGHNYCVVVVKQSWRLMPGGGMRPLDMPRPIRLGDEFEFSAQRSSVRLPSDLVPYKPHAEFMMFGRAQRLDATQAWMIKAQIGDWSKSIKVYGAREWHRKGTGWELSEPVPATSAVVDYSGSYGGSYELPPAKNGEAPLVVAYAPNPGGRGWLGSGHGETLTDAQKASLRHQIQGVAIAAPSLEVPRLIKETFKPDIDQEPVGLGSFTPWSPQRMSLLKRMAPPKPDQIGYPDDFPETYWQQTAPDQWLKQEIYGGEILEISGVFKEGDVRYRIPRPQSLLYIRAPEILAFTLKTHIDTIILDLDERVMEVVERRLVNITGLTQDISIEVLKRTD